MPWTPQGPYSPGSAFSSANANNIEAMYLAAALLFGPDLLAPFVLSGGVCTKDGGNPKQLDVTQCVYYAKQATDSVANTIYKRTVIASITNQFLTVTASTTYFLDYNPDGTTSWGTAHSAVANYVPICSVTTDGSGNINVVTDARPLNIQLFPSASGPLLIPTLRNGVVALVPLYTGGNTPVGDGVTTPATGSFWAKG